MKSALSWLVALAAVVGGAAYLVNTYHTRAREQAYWLEVGAAKQEFLQKAQALSVVSDEAYPQEVLRALGDYFMALRQIGAKYPDLVDYERERKAGEADLAAGKISETQKRAREERIDITLALFEKMKSGEYRPLYSKADKTFRFDIYEMGREKISGHDRIKLAYVHWGIFGPVDYAHIEGHIHTQDKPNAPLEVRKFEASGQPPSLQVKPEQWVRELIPGVEIGYYDLPLFPQEATAVDLAFDFNILTPARTHVPVHIAFENIPVPDSWKLGADQKWQAVEERVSEEELRAMKGEKAEAAAAE